MFKRLSILGLGPHRDFQATLQADGITVLSGPSEAGKSFILEAMLLCLWGQSTRGKFQPEAIHEDFSKAVVELTLDDGRTLRRSITRSRSTTRVIIEADQRQSYPNEDAFRAALGPLGRDPEILRLVLVPLGWQPLVAGNARKFRDLLGRILPEADVAAEIRRRMSGHRVSDDECAWSEKDATTYRRDARKVRDHHEGRRAAAEERVAGLQASEITLPEPFDRTPLDAALLWEAYDRETSGQAAAHARQAEWDRQRNELGEAPPAHPAGDNTVAQATDAQRKATAATQVYQEVYGRYQAATAQQQTFGALTDPSTCPMCQRPGWDQGAEMAAQAQAHVMAVQQEFMSAQNTHQEAHAALKEVTGLLEQVREAETRVTSWERSIAALGIRPQVAAPETAEPSLPRPDLETARRVRDLEDAAIAAGGARARWVEELAAARTLVETEAARHAEALAEAERADHLVEAIRAAPSALAAKQAEALGELGPVTLVFGENPAVEVHIDARPFWLASRGRQVVADVWLRAAIRRVAGVERLPIAVDNIQDVGGQPLPDSAPAIHMRTTNDERLEVSEAGP